jgi:transmembrane protein EpsG
MAAVAIFNTVVVLFAYLARYKGHEFFLKVSFFLIFLFLALRYDYGNDYPAYLLAFFDINSYASIDYLDTSWDFEPGWLFLCRLFQPLGFFAMVAVLAAFNCFVYYRFIKEYVSPGYYWFAVFLYVFNAALMLTHSSAMRQSLAICLFLFCIDCINKKHAIRYFLCIGLACLFHSSAEILLLVYLLGVFDWKINRTMAIFLFATYLLLFQYGGLLIPALNRFVGSNFSRYEEYGGTAEMRSGLGLVFSSALFGLVLYYDFFQTEKTSLLFKIFILSYFIVPLSLSLAMLERLGMYFEPAMLIVFPTIVLNIKNFVFKIALLALIGFLTLYGFYMFFQSETYREPFRTYKTIFSAPSFY